MINYLRETKIAIQKCHLNLKNLLFLFVWESSVGVLRDPGAGRSLLPLRLVFRRLDPPPQRPWGGGERDGVRGGQAEVERWRRRRGEVGGGGAGGGVKEGAGMVLNVFELFQISFFRKGNHTVPSFICKSAQ